MVFSYSDRSEVFVKESAFPVYQFRLPLSSWALAGWPMVIGGLTLATFWLGVAFFVLLPTLSVVKNAFPIVVPQPTVWGIPATLALLAMLTWLQAVLWTTFPVVFIRAVAAIIVIAGIPTAVAVGVGQGVSPWIISPTLRIEFTRRICRSQRGC